MPLTMLLTNKTISTDMTTYLTCIFIFLMGALLFFRMLQRQGKSEF